MNRKQYNRAKKAFLFLTRPETRKVYGDKYNHASYNTCAFGILYHAKVIKSDDVYYASQTPTFGSPIKFRLVSEIVLTDLFGYDLHRNMFSGCSGITAYDAGLPQFDDMITRFHETLNEYERDNGLPLTVVSAVPVETASKAIEGINRLRELHDALSSLSDINRERYGVTDKMLNAIENDVAFLEQYQ